MRLVGKGRASYMLAVACNFVLDAGSCILDRVHIDVFLQSCLDGRCRRKYYHLESTSYDVNF